VRIHHCSKKETPGDSDGCSRGEVRRWRGGRKSREGGKKGGGWIGGEKVEDVEDQLGQRNVMD